MYQHDFTFLQVKSTPIPELFSNQEETDTRVVLYLKYAVTLGYKSAVVRSPDTDVFMILLYHSHSIDLTIYLDTGVGKQRRLVNVSELGQSLGEDYCGTLLGYYVFTGEDCTSAFKGKGKIAPLKKLQKNPRFHAPFRLAPSTIYMNIIYVVISEWLYISHNIIVLSMSLSC